MYATCHNPYISNIADTSFARSTHSASLTSSVQDYRIENGRRYHAYRDGSNINYLSLSLSMPNKIKFLANCILSAKATFYQMTKTSLTVWIWLTSYA